MNTSHLFTFALAAAEEPSVGTVVATGLILVFSVLILLYGLIVLQGKLFTAIDNKKKGKQALTDAKPAPSAIITPAAPLSAPIIEQGVPGEVVAAITAAIASMDGGKYTIRSLTRATSATRRSNAWSRAGVAEYTEPF